MRGKLNASAWYLDGEIFVMAGASPTHNLIATNTDGELGGQLKQKPCRVMASDMKVRTSDEGL